jgi:hypothetical protein
MRPSLLWLIAPLALAVAQVPDLLQAVTAQYRGPRIRLQREDRQAG